MKKLLLLFTVLLLWTVSSWGQSLNEGFENESPVPPEGWTVIYGDNDPTVNTVIHSTDRPYNGARSFRFSSVAYDVSYITGQYLITPELNLTGGDHTISFWYKRHTDYSTEPFKVGWSSTGNAISDFTSWSDVITNATTTWQQYVKTDLPEGTKHVAIYYMSENKWHLYIDQVEIYGPNDPPNCATLVSPRNVDTDVNPSESLNWASGIGAPPTSYKLYFGTDNPPTNIINGTDLGNVTSYNPAPEGMGYSTTYYWQVVAYNNDIEAADCPVWSFTTMADPTIVDFPYTQNFDGTWSGTPAAPLGWTVINADDDDFTWNQANTYIGPAHSGEYAAHGMGNTDDYLITPPINLTGVNTRIKWWDKVEDAEYVNSYKVLVSTTTNEITSFTNDLGTFDCANEDWTEHVLNLSAFTGQTIYVAFHQTASADTYYGFGIDDFTVEEMPTTPLFAISPESKDFGGAYVGEGSAAQTFTITNTGIGTLIITSDGISFTGDDASQFALAPLANDISLIAEQSAIITVNFTPTTEGSKTATLNIAHNAPGLPSTVSLSGTALPAGSLFESFEGSIFPPVGWAVDAYSWEQDHYESYDGTKSAILYNYDPVPDQKLITPKIVLSGNESLSFYAKYGQGPAKGDPSEEIQIKYSSDKTTWFDIGDAIALSPVFTKYVIDLFNIDAGNYYLAFSANSSGLYNDFYIDYVMGPLFFPEIPGPATIDDPADDETDVSIYAKLFWSSGATGGIPDGYKLFFGTNGEGTTTPTNIENGTEQTSPYSLPVSVDYNTIYYWQVVPFNTLGNATDCPIWSFTTMDDPTLTPPFTEEFDDYLPTGWREAKGLLSELVEFTEETSNWTDDDFANAGENDAARINIYGSSRKEWLITTPIDLGEGSTNYRLTFDLALTKYGSTGAPAMNGTDDKFAVVISTDNGVTWSSLNTLMLWDNEGSANVFNAISYTGEKIIIDLSLYSGIVQIGFYGESTISNADNDLFVDNVSVVPTTPVFAVSPAVKNFGRVVVGETSTQTFTISNIGIGTLGITDVTLSGTDVDQFTLSTVTYPINLAGEEIAEVNVAFMPTSEGDKTASLVISDDQNRNNHTLELTGVGFIPPQGSTCDNPLPLVFPAVDITGNTGYYGNDYSRSDIEPISYYLDGDDVVYQFTVLNDGLLEGTITTSKNWLGAFIMADCPNSTNPPTPLIEYGSEDETSITFNDNISAGTYFLIISSYPLPQSIDYTINLNIIQPATSWNGSTDNEWHNATNWDNGVPGSITDVIIPTGLNSYPTIRSAAFCNTITLESGASLLGNEFLTVTGDAIVEHEITGDPYDWHLLSSPVAAQAIEGDFTPESGYDFYAWDELTAYWLNQKMSDNNITSFVPGKGYLVAYQSPETKSFVGNLNSGNIAFSLNNTGTGDYKGSNLLGNPYPSSIDWKSASGLDKSKLVTETDGGHNMYIYNPANNNYGTFNDAGSAGTNDITQYIAPMQGFFVIAGSTGSFVFNNAARVHSSQNWMKSGNDNAFSLSVTAPANAGKDEILLDFGHKASKGGADKWFSMSATAPSLYATTAERDYSIRFLTSIDENPMIPVAFKAGLDGEYSIQANFSQTTFSVKLMDQLTGNVQDLNKNPFYAFTATTGDDANRFNLVFGTLGIDNPDAAEAIQVYAYGDVLYLTTSSKESALVNVYNLTGQLVMQGKTGGNTLSTFNASKLSNGVYVVNVIFNQRVVSHKVVIRK